MRAPKLLKGYALACTLVLVALATPAFAAGAKITIVNNNAAGVGLNDPTPVAPVGGNPGTTLGQQRLNVFKKAAEIWGAELDSPIEITVLASMEPLTCTATAATLGSAGQRFIYSDFDGVLLFPGAEFPNIWYGSPLASKRAGQNMLVVDPPTDVVGPVTDIRARFNSNLGQPNCLTGSFWYYGFDTNTPVGQNNLLTVLLHELAHGLGFQDFATLTNGSQILNMGDIYGHYLFDTTVGLHWNDMTNAQRAASAVNTRRVVWDGPPVGAELPGVMAFGRPLLRVTSPAGIAGIYEVGTAVFGAPLTATGITGQVVLGTDAANVAGPSTTDGCTPFTNAAAVAGKIALVDRGTCGFIVKVKNAQDAGATAVIVADNVAGGPPAGLGGVDPTITIPSGRVTLNDGNLLKANLNAGVTATLGLDMSVRSGADQQGRILMYTPVPLSGGSSVSHWDTAATPNLLMEPFINTDLTLSVKAPQDLTLAFMRDLGWFPDADSDGLNTDADQCDASDLRATIYVSGSNTGVQNVLFANGCTISDMITLPADEAGTHGDYVSAVRHVGNALKDAGIITNQEHAVLVKTAAQSKTGK